MKIRILFIILICTINVLPSKSKSTKKINGYGQYLPYYGQAIVAKIDVKFNRVAEQIEKFIRTSNSRSSYSALPFDTYHMSIYTIFSNGNKLIKPVKQWVDKKRGRTIPNQGWLPVEVLEKQNRKALCILKKYLNEPLNIKYASLKVGSTVLSLSLELQDESLRRIHAARKALKEVYDHQNKSMEPINKKLHITLAYVYGKKHPLYIEDWNRLNNLVKVFNGGKLSIPYLYLYGSMAKYYKYQTSYLDCRVYNFW